MSINYPKLNVYDVVPRIRRINRSNELTLRNPVHMRIRNAFLDENIFALLHTSAEPVHNFSEVFIVPTQIFIVTKVFFSFYVKSNKTHYNLLQSEFTFEAHNLPYFECFNTLHGIALPKLEVV